MATKAGWVCGVCPKCNKTLCRKRPADLAVCDCWMYCPLCGRKMEPYTPDLTPQFYTKEDIDIVMICRYHTPPHKSTQKPVTVTLE
ncbi:MAG: hypothetical protein ACE5KC_00405 [Candidatus Bathyarchaeia archaeon]